jgi:predicted porin
MKKLLIATAALAMVAGTAQAQSSVSVYGIMDMSYGYDKSTGNEDAEDNKKSTAVKDDANASSRLGFRGTEDLGGGVKAGFVVEANLDMVKGTTFNKSTNFLGSTRQATLSLSDAKLGTIGIGYKKTLETDFNDKYFTGTENSAGNTAHTDFRLTRGDGIYYTSPSFSGVTFSAQLTTAEVNPEVASEATTDSSMTQFGVNYAAGALEIGGVFFNGSLKQGDDDTFVPKSEDAGFGVGDNDYKGYGIGANYNFGVAKVTAQMGERKLGLASVQTKAEYSALGVTVPVGKVDLKAVYTMGEYKLSGAKVDETTGYQLIAQYNLSKRTNAYVIYGQNTFESATAGTADVKDSTARVGLVHSF